MTSFNLALLVISFVVLIIIPTISFLQHNCLTVGFPYFVASFLTRSVDEEYAGGFSKVGIYLGQNNLSNN